jgi:hypothetical protein
MEGASRVSPAKRTTGKPVFAVRQNLCRAFFSGARQKAYLPCVFYRAHGKEKTHDK